ncbi:sulfatase-like hydrolase/transferase [Desertivirga xinjiangensis]|uniref:sulfatase-like hydrolase/transferase n=1 Tax=Desertivirga xinjiangensis TaxID=539206 RepID=UPI00210DDC52|nr:sulfatase-like hydrolase/transferase [Pedobacter xinjiangensis]
MNIGIKQFVVIVCLFWSPGKLVSQEKIRSKEPNIIVIVSDDAGYADFGVYGGKEIPTPNIDLIAGNGILFSDAYVSASVCAPSRAGILTGRYQQRFGFEHNISNKPADGYQLSDIGLDPNEKTIGDHMKSNGYRTIAIGKWHQGEEEKHFPLNRGFDEFYGFLEGHRDFFAYRKERARKFAMFDNHQIVPESEIGYLTDMFTERASLFITENQDKPFFMYLAYNAVHVPMNAKPELMNKFSYIPDKGRRAYAAMMASLDEGVGSIVNVLQKNDLFDNTLIVFINDNGAATGNFSDNGHLRGLKGSKWEGGIRVACLMQWPGHIPAGKKYNQTVSALDIVPTAIAAAGGRHAGIKPLDGKDLLPFISGRNDKTPHKILFWRRGVAAAVRNGEWKLIRSGPQNPVLLFNLKKDISETTNLASRYPAKVKRLSEQLEKWEKTIDKPHWESAYGDYNQIMKHRMEVSGREMELKYP